MRKFTHRFNDLPEEERKHLVPFLIEDHISHLEQAKLKAQRAHKKLMSDYNGHIKNLQEELREFE